MSENKPLPPVEIMSLAAAMCHEIGNHLAAVRLTAHLIATGDEAQPAAQGVISASAEAGHVLSQMRALLRGGAAAQTGIFSVTQALRDMRVSLGDELDGPIFFEIGSGVGLPRLHFNQEILRQQMTEVVQRAAAAINGPGNISVRISADNEFVTFTVDDDGPPVDPTIVSVQEPLRGRALALQVTRFVLAGGGGAVTFEASAGRNRVRLHIPVAKVPA